MPKFLALVALLLFPTGAALAQDESWPVYETVYVNDYAGIIDQDAETRITKRLTILREETGVEATVLTLNTRQGYTPTATMEEFATRLFNHWGIGDATRNDGILVLVLKDDREMRIELGSGYGSGFNGEAQDIVDRVFLPEFKTENYSYGIEAGTDAVIERIARANWNGETPPARDGSGSIIIAILAVFGAATLFGNRIFDRFRRCPNCGARNLKITRQVIEPASRHSMGRGNRITDCRSCGHHSVVPYTIAKRGSSSSGGFGGGRSSGGGASGRW